MVYRITVTTDESNSTFNMDMSYQEWVAIKKFISRNNEVRNKRVNENIPYITLEELN